MHIPAILLTFVGALVLTLPVCAGSGDLIVSPDGPLKSLEAALEVAEDGSVIEVRGGVYAAPLFIEKSVTVIGVDHPVIDGQGKGSLVIVRAPDVTFQGFTLRGTGASMTHEDTALVAQAPRVTFADNVLEDVLFGIYFAEADYGIARNNDVGAKELDVGLRGDSVRVWYSNHVTLEGNTISGGRDTLIWYADQITIRDNRIVKNRYGLHFMYNKQARVVDNIIENNTVGAYMMYSADLVFAGNRVVNNRGASGYGLAMKDMDNALVKDNIFANNIAAIFLDNSPSLVDGHNDFTGNLFAFNEIGITALPSVSRNVFQSNTFLENAQQASTMGRGNMLGNVWQRDGVGNYWSDYSGFDEDRDGIGDMPYRSEKLFESLADSHPILRLFAYSPATQALNFAAAAFPSLRPDPRLIDDAPLMRYSLPQTVGESAAPSRLPFAAFSFALLGLGTVVCLFALHFVFPRSARLG